MQQEKAFVLPPVPDVVIAARPAQSTPAPVKTAKPIVVPKPVPVKAAKPPAPPKPVPTSKPKPSKAKSTAKSEKAQGKRRRESTPTPSVASEEYGEQPLTVIAFFLSVSRHLFS